MGWRSTRARLVAQRSRASMLGLGDYDSPAEGESPDAAAAAAPASSSQLSIVDYHDGQDDDDEPEAPTDSSVLGVTLDDDAVQRATQRRVGGTHISVVKRSSSSQSAASAAASSAPSDSMDATGDREPSDGRAAPPAFKLPDSPQGELSEEMARKFRALVEKTKEARRAARRPLQPPAA